jgi:tripartite-type tricarboxylate transporter receptor subunit TctC
MAEPPVRIINTFAPGGAADILARLATDHLSRALGRQFFVETRAGAGGVIGVQFVAHAEPDGYNFVVTTLSSLHDFIARGRASDKPLTYSSSGVGSNGHLIAEFFGRKTGIKVEHVPYKGATQGPHRSDRRPSRFFSADLVVCIRSHPWQCGITAGAHVQGTAA